MYTLVEVVEAVVVRMHSSDPKYQDCDWGPNVGLTSHEDLRVTLVPDTNNLVVVVVNIRAIEVLKINYFTI